MNTAIFKKSLQHQGRVMQPRQSLNAALVCLTMAAIVLALMLTGCASYTPADWAALSFAVAGSAADVYTTERALDNGGYECNPVFGSDPSDGKLIAGKVLALLACVAVGELEPRWRPWLFGLLGVSGGAAAAMNRREY